MNDLPNELPPNPLDYAAPQEPDLSGTQAGFLSNVSPPTQDQAPVGQIPTEDMGHEQLSGTYSHDPRTIDTPKSDAFHVLTPFSWFGGAEDAAEERRHPGKGDAGGLAGGGRTFDPRTGMESHIPVIALPPQWKKVMPYGTQFDVYNPKDPSRRVTVVFGDQGPAGYTGKGADLYAEKDIRDHLKLESGEQIGMDLTNVIQGKAPQLTQPPQPGTSYDQQVGNQIRERMSTQPQALMAGDMFPDAINRAMKNDNPTRNPDGSLNYGEGISVYPDTGIIQYETGHGGPVYQKVPGSDKLQKFTPHAPPQTPELVKETREAQKPLVNDDGTAKSNLQLQKQLDEYYASTGLAAPKIRQEAENIVKMQMSSRNPWSKQYLAIAPNYDTIADIASKPGRTGADDVAMLQAIANIEAPGRSSTGHDMHQWAKANGLAGQLGVTKARYGALYDFLTGKMTQDDWEKGGQTLPAELIPQLKRVADRAMEARYKQYITGITPVINRLKKLGVDPLDYIPDAVNPVTGISPFDEKGNIQDTFKDQTKVVKEVQPGTTRTMDPNQAVSWAKANQNSPDQRTRDAAEKILSSVGNSGP